MVGILPQAFALRPEEEYLSVTWQEFFSGDEREQLRCAVNAIRNSDLTVGAKAQFAVARVGDIRPLVENRPKGRKLRIIHEPELDNEAHAAIRSWPAEDDELFDLLAASAWSQAFTGVQIDQLPASECGKSARALA
ncbi:hypothetical protein [Rhizobium sp. BT-175]|uniref:hypothetical protein n=1 Tax=Rhizobium sp. BT-175 TaxID=2986929 RepID=UPI002235CF09|nr:hypothetical protein [Rhizobium sp. BT-175]MCV9942974.1 hypothetical protein [Rhizobium sp. BT-175]